MGLSAEATQTLKNNVAVGYALTYIFGSFGPILLLATVFPAMMGWNLRQEAKQLATRTKTSSAVLEPGQFNALRQVDTRVFKVDKHCPYIGLSAKKIFTSDAHAAIVSLIRDGQSIEISPDTTIKEGDLIAISAPLEHFAKELESLGHEVVKPKPLRLIEEVRHVLLTNHQFDKKTIRECLNTIEENKSYGCFITSVSRLGEKLAAKDELVLKKGDELSLVGRSEDLDKVSSHLGYILPMTKLTDFVFFGLGLALGVLIGLLKINIFGISVTLGSGVGCLFSGLFFGWLRSTHPRYASMPVGASNFLRDFGLAVFVASIGITAGPEAVNTIKQYGLELFFIGMAVTLIPQIITFYISYYLLKIKNPITLLATIAGGKSANPGFAALLDKAGNSTPVVPFTATYAVANILLTLWGPLIVSLI